ncbi:uncharacterized protein LOC106150383 [Lingula anatina]|uniref:Uncharacterized protein LOC106150383 n=1 Tax=Lingula anatina TaxID=7574 RepID=A0A1S3GZD9_LINAN|nr:uncharacterized protein LOC106150383 [Lingula anatina]|eukprot:XP_013378591.1 uncharacterized protein LOC106150383 [Lingula anatina]
MAMLIYATIMYYLRLYRLKHTSKTGYQDAFGPAVLTLFLCVAILSMLSLQSRNYLKRLEKENLIGNGFRNILHESSRCHKLNTTFPVFFEPSDVVLDPSGRYLWACSGNIVAKINIYTEVLEESIHVRGKEKYDFQGLTFTKADKPQIIYIATEFPTNRILVYDLQKRTVLDVVEMKHLLGRDPSFGGIAYSDSVWVGSGKMEKRHGTFFATSEQFIQIFTFITNNSTSELHLHPVALQSLHVHEKIGALSVYNNTLYALLDSKGVVRSWNMETSESRDFEIPTTSQLLEGIAFRWGGNISSSSDETTVFVSLNTPPQIWRLTFSQEKGFLEC